MGKKGYKLTSATSGDGPKTCAFFFSDKGCRNGANCKFSHERTAATTPGGGPPSVSSSSVVSSESGGVSDGEIVENKAGAYASLAKNNGDKAGAANFRPSAEPPACANPFLSAPQKEPVDGQPTEKKKRNKKRKKSQQAANSSSPLVAGDNIFDLGKAEARSPTANHNGTAAPPEASAAVASSPPTKKSKQTVASPQNNQKQHPTNNNAQIEAPPNKNNATAAVPNFRNLQLPVASFSIAKATATPAVVTAIKSPTTARPSTPLQHEPAPTPPPLPLPTATPSHLKWKNAVLATRSHVNYVNAFNYERIQQNEYSRGISTSRDWFTTRPYGQWCTSNPAAIAIDCEMCETTDPISGKVDTKALCRISVINADETSPNGGEVLLDTLVKPDWPVSNYRTWVNGISAKELENVQFTLRHAQTFLDALCSDQTVIVGHALHNDLLALRMVHHVTADTAMLYSHGTSVNGESSTPSLKNLAYGILKREMPTVHDSVNDARVTLACARHYVDNDGKVDTIEKVYTRSASKRSDGPDAEIATAMLLVHRLPPNALPAHISEMFIEFTSIKPKKVNDITFSGSHGKCHVEFPSREHADLAYRTLEGKEREDKNGMKQKRVGLKGEGAGYVCVRKMTKGK